MSKRNLAILSVLFSVFFIFETTARAQQTEAAAESKLFQVMLPVRAERVAPPSVPAEINQMLDRIVAAGKGKFDRGETEVLVWSGAGYQKAQADALIDRVTGAFKNAGWQYAPEGEEGGMKTFSATTGNPPRALVGFFFAHEQGLILTAMELLPNGHAANSQNAGNDFSSEPVAPLPSQSVSNANGGASIVGSWSNGYVSTLVQYAPVYGPPSSTPGKSRTWSYTFNADGTYSFTGLMQLQNAGCSNTIFQDKRGRYTIDGDRLTLTLTKNLWRTTDSCLASGNKEMEGKHEPETYTVTVGRAASGKPQVCLKNGEGEGSETCFERKER